MASPSEKATFVSAGITLFGGAIFAGFKLGFPDMIVPFGWALTLTGLGMLGLLVTVTFAIRWIIQDWSGGDRKSYVTGLQGWLVQHLTCEQLVKQLPNDEALDDAERTYKRLAKATAFSIFQNLGQAASVKYAGGSANRLNYPWPGEHTQACIKKRGDLLSPHPLEDGVS